MKPLLHISGHMLIQYEMACSMLAHLVSVGEGIYCEIAQISHRHPKNPVRK
jgi:hypothetical protein